MNREECWNCKFYKPFLRIDLNCYNCINRSIKGFENNFKEKEGQIA